MKYIINISYFLSLMLIFSCVGTTTDSNTSEGNKIAPDPVKETTTMIDTTTQASEEIGIPEESDIVVELPESHNCKIETEVYDGNQQWFRGKNTLVAITADESTFDEALGASHRVLVAYNTEDCSETFREVLPISVSADYPYYLTPIDSIKGELVGVQGTDRFYVFDVTNNVLSPVLNPDFKSNRQLDDAQSGAIVGMETWGRYLIGYAEDKGAFVYNLTIPKSPKQENAFAEYKQKDGSFASLFLLKEKGDDMQVVLPEYDMNQRQFALNPLLAEATNISQQVNKNALDNRFIVLRAKDEARTPIAIDMEKNMRVELPMDMKGKSTQEIVEWMKKQ